MTARPLVSVLTPTWQRHELLLGAMENVRAQTYRPLEHVIVSDGPDDDFWELFELADEARIRSQVTVQPLDLGRNWSTYLPDAYAAAPITVAAFLARGDYHAWLADDERMEPDHIVSLVDALEANGADFAYSKVRMYRPGQRPEDGYDIGTDPPRCGQITNCLYRADLLKRGLYVFGDDRTSDWATISRWQSRGAVHAFVDRVTLTHRADR